MALAVGLGAARHAYADLSAEAGVSAFEGALAMPKGAARDQALHEAQRGLSQAVAITPTDAALWRALAETRHLQATAGAYAGVSPELVGSTAEAAARAHALDPADPLAAARLAEAHMMLGQEPSSVAAPLSVSYAVAPESLALASWRPQVAFYAWPALEPVAQRAALLEACFYARETPERYAAMTAIGANSPHLDLQSRLLGLLKDDACQPVLTMAPVRTISPVLPAE